MPGGLLHGKLVNGGNFCRGECYSRVTNNNNDDDDDDDDDDNDNYYRKWSRRLVLAMRSTTRIT